MIIKRAEFIKSMNSYAEYPGQGVPEIAMVGKSNVGKSSVINRLTRMNKLAKVSGSPGKTRLINLFSINGGEFTLVDLPGYGFAKAPDSEIQKWGGMMQSYFIGSTFIKRVFMLVDIRHAPTSDDKLMIDYLRHYSLPFTVLANKADKLSKAAVSRAIPLICREIAVQPWQIIPFSAEDGTGLDKTLDEIEKAVNSSERPSEL